MRFRSEILPGLEHDPDFLDRIDQWVETAAREQPTAEEFLKALPGVWPGEAVASLRRQESQGRLPRKLRTNIEATLRRPPTIRPAVVTTSHPSRILEHPLDFEWLFTRAGQDVILRELQQDHPDGNGPVLCLGCPTLFERGRRLMPERSFVLWDKNASTLGQLSEAHSLAAIDLRHELTPELTVSAAVIDPPWYNDFVRLFLWSALRNLRPGGMVLMSTPPEGTRPSAAHDLVRIIRWAEDAGAELVSHQCCHLAYRSPLFEVNALAATGLASVPLDWRRGDLVKFRKRAAVHVDRPSIELTVEPWSEYRIGSLRWRLRTDEDAVSSHPLRTVWKSTVLPSVSARFHPRYLANFVTSGNRFFQTAFPERVAEFCCALDGRPTIDPHLQETVGPTNLPAPPRLARLVAGEQREAEDYFNRIDGL